MLKQKSFPLSAVCTSVTCALLMANSASVFAETVFTDTARAETTIESSSIRAEKSSFDDTEYRTSQMNFGGVGLMQMSTFRYFVRGMSYQSWFSTRSTSFAVTQGDAQASR